MAICAWNIAFIIFIKGYYMWRNKTKAARWEAMDNEQKNVYLSTTKDEGNKRLDFRFTH